MRLPICVVDAFTTEKFRGNPAAVCVLAAAMGEDWMQRVAAEMNLSETAFLVPQPDSWALRWFTPVAEVALCGHATLASAHMLWESGRLSVGAPAIFHTRQSGVLTCRQRDGRIEMDFPARPATETELPPGLAEALGAQPVWTGRGAYDYLCELADEAMVRNLRPDHAALAKLPVRGVIVTARGSGDYDCVSRFFAPGVGVAEDPVTGSAHCTLGPFWAQRLGKSALHAWQASARGGEVRVRLEGDRVLLGGNAVTVWRGELM
ncbi:MAG TPA: PhzF family phenazine biosynthesis protein [Candidatus Limnocylindria bacterium]|nr:PhzF family phenazine biosynthesis protein [Candidatus Limnocylindria bacterium]